VLTISPAVRIYVATGTTDLRRSIDGLAALVRERFDLDPLSGHLFLFRNRRGDRLKRFSRGDQGGFWVLYKRLERGTFRVAGRGRQPAGDDPQQSSASAARGRRSHADASAAVVRAGDVSGHGAGAGGARHGFPVVGIPR
jgi:transposase